MMIYTIVNVSLFRHAYSISPYCEERRDSLAILYLIHGMYVLSAGKLHIDISWRMHKQQKRHKFSIEAPFCYAHCIAKWSLDRKFLHPRGGAAMPLQTSPLPSHRRAD